MNIVILGAGQVGASLAESLSDQGNDITLVDANAERLQAVQEYHDIRTVCGHCSYPDILRDAGVADADMIVAVTDNDEANIVACQIADSLFKTPLKIAHVHALEYFSNDDKQEAQAHIPVDVFIHPEDLIRRSVQHLVNFPGATQVSQFAEGNVKLVGIKPYYGGALLGKTVGSFIAQFSDKATIVAIYRNEKLIKLKSDLVFEIGDELFFMAADADVHFVMDQFRRPKEPYQRIIIAGGGGIGLSLAKALQYNYQVKLIEKDRKRCEHLATHLDNVLVLNGEAGDLKLLKNENIEDIDLFCAVTNDDEDNMLACIQAKRLGAGHTMCLIMYKSYLGLIDTDTIDTEVSPQMATVSAILTHVRQGDILDVRSLKNGTSEAFELVVKGDEATSRVIGKAIADLRMPTQTKIGALCRNGKVIMPADDVVIRANDHIIFFTTRKSDAKTIGDLFHASS